jgi:hypothetical protein
MDEEQRDLSQENTQRKLEEERDRNLREAVAIGVEAKNFLNSDLARYIRNAAEARLIAAQNKLGKVDPTNVKEIVKLQTVIAQFEHYESCLEEIVAAGDTAYQLYLIDNQPEE